MNGPFVVEEDQSGGGNLEREKLSKDTRTKISEFRLNNLQNDNYDDFDLNSFENFLNDEEGENKSVRTDGKNVPSISVSRRKRKSRNTSVNYVEYSSGEGKGVSNETGKHVVNKKKRRREDDDNDDILQGFGEAFGNETPNEMVLDLRRKRRKIQIRDIDKKKKRNNLHRVFERDVPGENGISLKDVTSKSTSFYKRRYFCELCGDFASYTCFNCGERYCSVNCYIKHKQKRCFKLK